MLEAKPLIKKREGISNSVLILFALGTAFFPRVLTYFGAPAPINFVHFLIVPAITLICILNSNLRSRRQAAIVQELIVASVILFICTMISAVVNNAGIANILLQYMIMAEPFILLMAVMSIPLAGKTLSRFRKWILIFGASNLILAIAQSILLPIGLYPRRGGTVQDNTAGVFAGSSGSAGNYVSCTLSVYFALYLFGTPKIPQWVKAVVFVAALYQTYVSDSKQVFVAFIGGFFLLILSKIEEPVKIICYLVPFALLMSLFIWGLQNPDIEFLDTYRNWTHRAHLYSFDGDAFQTKSAAFRIIPTHFESPLNWLFGLGPGHTVTRLGGWMIKKYASLLAPIGVSVHPVSAEVFQVVWDGWIAQESTIFFPLFTWAGIWGDLGIVGLLSYLYLCSVVWRHLCVDDVCRFIVLSTVVLGFILTQMEEPGQMLTAGCLIALRWHERKDMRQQRLVRSLEVQQLESSA